MEQLSKSTDSSGSTDDSRLEIQIKPRPIFEDMPILFKLKVLDKLPWEVRNSYRRCSKSLNREFEMARIHFKTVKLVFEQSKIHLCLRTNREMKTYVCYQKNIDSNGFRMMTHEECYDDINRRYRLKEGTVKEQVITHVANFLLYSNVTIDELKIIFYRIPKDPENAADAIRECFYESECNFIFDSVVEMLKNKGRRLNLNELTFLLASGKEKISNLMKLCTFNDLFINSTNYFSPNIPLFFKINKILIDKNHFLDIIEGIPGTTKVEMRNYYIKDYCAPLFKFNQLSVKVQYLDIPGFVQLLEKKLENNEKIHIRITFFDPSKTGKNRLLDALYKRNEQWQRFKHQKFYFLLLYGYYRGEIGFEFNNIPPLVNPWRDRDLIFSELDL